MPDHNTGPTDRNLSNWRIRDRSVHRYRIPKGFKLKAGRYVRIHTGKGADDRNDLYWGNGWYIWNNDGDRGTLKNKVYDVKDRCSYRGDGSAVGC